MDRCVSDLSFCLRLVHPFVNADQITWVWAMWAAERLLGLNKQPALLSGANLVHYNNERLTD